jgi:hypothetical protein
MNHQDIIGIKVDNIPPFFDPLFFSKQNKDKQKDKNKIIRLFDSSCKEYIKITQKIFKIPNANLFFHLYEKVEFIYTTEIDSDFITKISINNKDNKNNKNNENKYVLFTYLNCLEDEYSVFLTSLKKTLNPCLNHCSFFSILIRSYYYLLDTLHNLSLIEKPICLLSLSSSTIFFTKDNIPILFQLENAFSISFLNNVCPLFMDQIMYKITQLKNFSYQPIEVHLLYFLYKNKSPYLSISDLVEVINHYLLSMPFFSLFTEEEKEKYRESCVEAFKHLVSLDFLNIFFKILKESSFSWDNFALSMLYYTILEKINVVFPSEEFVFFREWTKLLLKNLNGNPLRREKVMNTRHSFDKLFQNYPNWLYIKQIDKGKMDLLRNKLTSTS